MRFLVPRRFSVCLRWLLSDYSLHLLLSTGVAGSASISVTVEIESTDNAVGDYSSVQAVLWNMDNLQTENKPEEHKHVITDVRFRPNSTDLATASFDGSVRLWMQLIQTTA